MKEDHVSCPFRPAEGMIVPFEVVIGYNSQTDRAGTGFPAWGICTTWGTFAYLKRYI